MPKSEGEYSALLTSLACPLTQTSSQPERRRTEEPHLAERVLPRRQEEDVGVVVSALCKDVWPPGGSSATLTFVRSYESQGKEENSDWGWRVFRGH